MTSHFRTECPSPRGAARAALLLLLALSALSAGCRERAREPRRQIWRFAIEETAGSVQDMYAQAFKRRVEQRTQGAVGVVVYPYGTLGTSDQLLEQLHNGTLAFAMSSPGHLGKLIPEVQAFLLHFVLDARDQVNACALSDPELRARLDAHYREKGLSFLTAFSEGDMAWTTHVPVRSPEDFAGIKLRVMTSPILMAAYEAYGASPTPLPYSEVYSALQLRMIDGQVNPVFAIQEMSFYEVSSHLTIPDHAVFVTTLASNGAFLAALSPARRRLVSEVVAELAPYIDRAQRELNAERLARIRAARPTLEIATLTEAERARFRERARSARARFLELAGPAGAALLATLERAVARCRTAEAADEGGGG